MTGRPVLLDSNILIDVLNGHREAQVEWESHEGVAISVLTWIEVMAGAREQDREGTLRFLRRHRKIAITDAIAVETVRLRREQRLKLPDSVILATAIAENLVLVTRNTRDFGSSERVRIPYKLTSA
jgi:predicted nucleic acid-binding protein